MRAFFRTFVLVVTLCTALGGAPARAQSPVRLEARPVFEGMSAGIGPYPLVITLANTGADTTGVLSVEPKTFMESSRRYDYAIPLPEGSIKRVVAYPMAANTMELSVRYRGDFAGRTVVATLPVSYDSASQVGLVSDRPGGLAALYGVKPKARPGDYSEPKVIPSTARPEDAPDRAAGYASLNVLTLAEGAERMQPAQWDAIRRWTLGGGTLVLSGGPGAVYLRTPEARALSPLERTGGATASALRLGAFGGTLPRPVGLTTGPLKRGARALVSDGGKPLVAEMSLGTGRVVFTAFSLVEPPFRTWNQQAAFWSRLLKREVAGPNSVWSQAMRSAGAAPYTTPPPGATQAGTDPFKIQLPPMRVVGGLFLAYFILVVPVSYFTLRRMRRLEWAWASGPLLSAVFAGGFGLFAADLYQAGLSRKTAGLLAATADAGTAQFIGSTEMFFPRGGRHPLTIPNAETLENTPIASDPYGFRRANQGTVFVTTDTGTVEAPNYRVPNLAFREMFFAAPAPWGGLSGAITRNRHGGVSGRIRNDTGYVLRDVTIVLVRDQEYQHCGSWLPGYTQDLSGRDSAEPFWTFRDNPSERERLRQRSPAVAQALHTLLSVGANQDIALVIARTDGGPFGPPLGRETNGSGVDVIVTLPYTRGGS